MREVVLVPIKPFDVAKSRLRGSLPDDALDRLIRELARGVITAAAPRECWVLCDDDNVAAFATDCGAHAVVVARGLNDAVRDGYLRASENFELIIVAHADLAQPTGLGSFAFDTEMTIAMDRHGAGTNVLALPAGLSVTFHFGVDSARAHELEAAHLGIPVRTLRDSPWAVDIDEPADLAHLPRT